MADEPRSKVINVAKEPHKKFRHRCVDLEISMSKRASFLLELDNAGAIPYNTPDEKKLKEKKRTREEEIKRITKKIIDNKLAANLAARIGLTEACVQRIEAVGERRDSTAVNGLALEYLLSQEEDQ
jgi:hypothetical protein